MLVNQRVKCGADRTCTDGRYHDPYLDRYYREDDKIPSE